MRTSTTATKRPAWNTSTRTAIPATRIAPASANNSTPSALKRVGGGFAKKTISSEAVQRRTPAIVPPTTTTTRTNTTSSTSTSTVTRRGGDSVSRAARTVIPRLVQPQTAINRTTRTARNVTTGNPASARLARDRTVRSKPQTGAQAIAQMTAPMVSPTQTAINRTTHPTRNVTTRKPTPAHLTRDRTVRSTPQAGAQPRAQTTAPMVSLTPVTCSIQTTRTPIIAEVIQSSQLEKRNEELSRALEDESARLNDALQTISELNAKVIYLDKQL
uniref:AlNc14C48G3835 protein n=1 Tax=Albugo laibachii Nc14 TaxID=890382 RepID=F0WAX4_9STRA|nr:AlNc14C48G3835 [Albugo laibachii Nc14]CCA18431.1 AlNc14C50G3955 [Albugo laibachii Nc14]|eukprot:CCA18431.1 AlNc14C50G3955 [Albugo laibachii Nc14]